MAENTMHNLLVLLVSFLLVFISVCVDFSSLKFATFCCLFGFVYYLMSVFHLLFVYLVIYLFVLVVSQ